MSSAPCSHPSLCPSPSLAIRSIQAKANPLAFSQNKHFLPNTYSFSATSTSFLHTHLPKPSSSWAIVRASETEYPQTSSKADTITDGGGGVEEEVDKDEEEYEVELEQPYGIKFAKGRDGATYIDAIAPGGSADKTGKFTVGDKVLATSAVFGQEIWPAAEYGRTMYTIRQRIGLLYMKMLKRYGNTDYTGELTEKDIIRAERNSGVISNRVREIQVSKSFYYPLCFLMWEGFSVT
uniref:PDZ domain-containing protein n=1 Tax=Rhizophora mucronata TaxID=61149 RepID=A0A2P2KCG5_RHIMU